MLINILVELFCRKYARASQDQFISLWRRLLNKLFRWEAILYLLFFLSSWISNILDQLLRASQQLFSRVTKRKDYLRELTKLDRHERKTKITILVFKTSILYYILVKAKICIVGMCRKRIKYFVEWPKCWKRHKT